VTAAAATAVSSVLGDAPQLLQQHLVTLVAVERLPAAQHTTLQVALVCDSPLVACSRSTEAVAAAVVRIRVV
jgi:hypothetical protein